MITSDKALVLITDDNEINSMMAADILESVGIQCDVAENGPAAIELVREKKYDLIFMDMVMPLMDGVETTYIIKTITDTPVVGMSADMSLDLKHRFADAGAVSCLAKPFEVEDVKAALVSNIPEEKLPDKFFRNAGTSNQPEMESELKKRISGIVGMDYEDGLRRSMGNEENYYKLLKASVGNIHKYLDMLKDYGESADDNQLKLAAHSLKSVFANLGAAEMSKGSANIESLAEVRLKGAEGDQGPIRQSIKTELASFTTRIGLIDEELGAAIAEYDQNLTDSQIYSERRELDAEELASLRRSIDFALKRYDIDYLLQGLELLYSASDWEDRKIIEAAVEAASEFEYENVRLQLDKLQRDPVMVINS